MKKLVDDAAKTGSRVIFVGYERGSKAYQSTILKPCRAFVST